MRDFSIDHIVINLDLVICDTLTKTLKRFVLEAKDLEYLDNCNVRVLRVQKEMVILKCRTDDEAPNFNAVLTHQIVSSVCCKLTFVSVILENHAVLKGN